MQVTISNKTATNSSNTNNNIIISITHRTCYTRWVTSRACIQGRPTHSMARCLCSSSNQWWCRRKNWPWAQPSRSIPTLFLSLAISKIHKHSSAVSMHGLSSRPTALTPTPCLSNHTCLYRISSSSIRISRTSITISITSIINKIQTTTNQMINYLFCHMILIMSNKSMLKQNINKHFWLIKWPTNKSLAKWNKTS